MKQKLVIEKAHFNDRLEAEEADEIEVMEDKLDDEAPWELAFEHGVQLADDEMVDGWEDEEEFE